MSVFVSQFLSLIPFPCAAIAHGFLHSSLLSAELSMLQTHTHTHTAYTTHTDTAAHPNPKWSPMPSKEREESDTERERERDRGRSRGSLDGAADHLHSPFRPLSGTYSQSHLQRETSAPSTRQSSTDSCIATLNSTEKGGRRTSPAAETAPPPSSFLSPFTPSFLSSPPRGKETTSSSSIAVSGRSSSLIIDIAQSKDREKEREQRNDNEQERERERPHHLQRFPFSMGSKSRPTSPLNRTDQYSSYVQDDSPSPPNWDQSIGHGPSRSYSRMGSFSDIQQGSVTSLSSNNNSNNNTNNNNSSSSSSSAIDINNSNSNNNTNSAGNDDNSANENGNGNSLSNGFEAILRCDPYCLLLPSLLLTSLLSSLHFTSLLSTTHFSPHSSLYFFLEQ
jgi:hypothetical protein